jgi:hypothetical protein
MGGTWMSGWKATEVNARADPAGRENWPRARVTRLASMPPATSPRSPAENEPLVAGRRGIRVRDVPRRENGQDWCRYHRLAKALFRKEKSWVVYDKTATTVKRGPLRKRGQGHRGQNLDPIEQSGAMSMAGRRKSCCAGTWPTANSRSSVSLQSTPAGYALTAWNAIPPTAAGTSFPTLLAALSAPFVT